LGHCRGRELRRHEDYFLVGLHPKIRRNKDSGNLGSAFRKSNASACVLCDAISKVKPPVLDFQTHLAEAIHFCRLQNRKLSQETSKRMRGFASAAVLTFRRTKNSPVP
jgi:hypothetical protein